MKKIIVAALMLTCVLGLVGCDRSMNDIIENEPSLTGIVKEVSENWLLIECEATAANPWTEYSVSRNVESEDSMTDFDIGDEVVVYYDGNIAETTPLEIGKVYAITLKTPANRESEETVSFHDKTFNKSDLSEETLAWLERYNTLSPEEQLAISSIPKDLYDLCGYGEATEEIAPSEIEPIDYSPMIMFNDILYTATNYTGDKEDLTVVGKIESCIDYGMPTENNQANDNLVGCEIYASSSIPDYIFVLYEGEYSPYKAIGDAGIE